MLQAIPIIIVVGIIFVAGFVWYKKRWPKSVLYVPRKPSSTISSQKKKKSSRLRNFFRYGFKGPPPASSTNDQETGYTPSTHSTNDARDPSITEMTTTSDAPNRNRGSIRSIMTLPTYHPSPRAGEQLIAREGERAGVDTVVEYPETLDEEEARREADMAALYEIRQARRREIEERNERRAARAEARENGDWARLEQLRLEGQMRQQARAEAERERTGSGSGSSLTLLPTVSPAAMPEQGVGGNGSSQSLIAGHTARTTSRDRRISSVSYADLGLARHDGSRLRENSVDSDHRPLLDGAALMGTGAAGVESDNNSRRGSLFNSNIFHDGRRHRAASAESVVTTESELAGAAGSEMTPQTSSGEHSSSDPAVRTPSASEPSPPTEDPPQYEDAPPYTSPVAGRGEGMPRLPSLRLDDATLDTNVPAIQISESTPILGDDEGDLGERQ